MDEIRAESWLHLQELLYEDSWQEPLGRFRSDLVFRGQQDASSDLSTSLARAERPGIARRIVVPTELKWEVRDKLDQANMTERVLFPGLDGIAHWLTRHYSPGRVAIGSGGTNRP